MSEYYKYQSISKAEKAQIDFEYIYQNYNTSYITFLCDDRMQTWSSLKKYSFKNPFLLKSKPTRIKEIDIIYNDINHFFINKIASINILYNNIYEYNDYLIINTNEHFYPNETLPFLNELIKSIEKRNYNMVVIPLNCDLENDEVLSTKFNLINTNGNTLYVSSW